MMVMLDVLIWPLSSCDVRGYLRRFCLGGATEIDIAYGHSRGIGFRIQSNEAQQNITLFFEPLGMNLLGGLFLFF